MTETTITRRRVIGAGTLAAAPVPLTDQAEALLVEIARVFPRLTERDRSNVGHVLEHLATASACVDAEFAEGIEQAMSYAGPGRRVHDRMDGHAAAV
jgi:hypothetical protein